MMFSTILMDEVMAQPFYHPDDEVCFDPQSKRDALSLSHSIQNDSQQEMVDRNMGCINPGVEIDSKGRGSTRRRIPVACNRCRQRKIKCSGDVGDGQGCSNCRSSGNPNCQFLRVNSAMLQTKATGWPYPVNTMAPPSQRIGSYAPSMAPKMGILPGNSTNPRASPFSRAPDYEMGVSDPQNRYTRHSFGIDPAVNYEDESSAPYNAQPSAYMLPSSPQDVMADYCGLSWNPKGWNHSLQNGRATSEAIFTDNDAENTLAHSAYSFVFSGQGTQSTEIPSAIAMPGSLTSPLQGAERTLPNPNDSRNLFQGNTGGLITPTDTTSGLHLAHIYNKSGNRWMQKSDPRTSMQHTPNGPFSTSTVNRAKLIPSRAQDMVFGFLPLTSTGGSSPLIPSSCAFAGLEPVPDSGDEFRGSTDGRLRAFSRDNTRILSLTEYSSDSYGYSTSERNGRNRSEAGDTSSVSTLINGLPYMRPKHADPLSRQASVIPTNDLQQHYHVSTEMHRAPVSAVSNPSGF